MFVDGLAVGFRREGGAHGEDFAELEVRIVHEGEVFFAIDDPAQDFLGLLEFREAGFLVAAVLRERLPALRGEGDGEEVFAGIDGAGVGELRGVFAQAGGGFFEFADLEFAEGAAVGGGFDFGGLGMLGDEVGVALDRLLEETLAGGVAGRERHGFRGEDLRAEVVNQRGRIAGEGRAGFGFVECGERLVELGEVELAEGELDLRRLCHDVGGVAIHDRLVGGGGALVVRGGEERVGGFVLLCGGRGLCAER